MRKSTLTLCLCVILLFTGCSMPQTSNNVTPTDRTTSTSTSTTDVTVSSTTTATDSDDSTTTEDTSSTDTNNTTTTTAAPTSTGIPTTSATTTSTTTATTTGSTTQGTVIFKVTIRESSSHSTVQGVTVFVYVDNSSIAVGSAVTEHNGVATLTIPKGTSYRVTLDTLPAGYECNDEYRFSSPTVNITIRKASVHNEQDHSGAQYRVGDTMTDFFLTDVEGTDYRLSQLLKEKKLVILNFWYVSCQPCKEEFPYFEAAVQEYSDDISLLAINPIDNKNNILALRNQLNRKPETAVSFPMLRDTCNLFLGFSVTAYPTTVFLDTDGHILAIHVGAYPSEKALFAEIDKYLHK